MEIKIIIGETPGLKRFMPTTFIFCDNGAIYADNKEIGFFRHPKTRAEIDAHFARMKQEGFTIREISDPNTIEFYSSCIQKQEDFIS